MNPYSKMPPVVKNLLIINVLVFMAMKMLPVGDQITQWAALSLGTPWFHTYQYITYMFLHANLEHLFFNMFALWMFGRTLEYELGSQRFLIYYLACGIGAALVQYGVAWLMGELPLFLVGASGAVMGLLLAFGVMHPNATIMLLIPPIPMKAKWFVIIYAVIELFLGWRGVGQVAHFAHVGGMLWGWALLYYWKKRGEIYY
ncbi:MAG: rhomboid family intramembrane serine protease [Rikenellaceae bacterium]|nr:rhomboid family intramembrane serine protease [Rikenellaceae bacterium]